MRVWFEVWKQGEPREFTQVADTLIVDDGRIVGATDITGLVIDMREGLYWVEVNGDDEDA